jgi:hypothetical protein
MSGWVQAAKDAGLSTGRIWFYRPGKWTGWLVGIGHDEFARRTVWLGSWLTGAVVIAYRACGDPECEADRDRMIREELDERNAA